MKLNIGRIPFLVCAPFFYEFLKKENNSPFFNFIDGSPQDHNRALKNNTIDLSPASSITYAQNPDQYVLSSTLCTSSRFDVQSVKLFSQKPIEKLANESIHLTKQSATSVALLKILLSQYYNIEPKYIENTSYQLETARLLIGNEALLETHAGNFKYQYDLESLWEEWQKVPFVFGAWIIHQNALSVDKKPLLEEYLKKTESSVASFKASPSSALEIWLQKYPVQLPSNTIFSYYDSLDYEFTEERKKSLKLFYKLAAQNSIIPSAPKLKFL